MKRIFLAIKLYIPVHLKNHILDLKQKLANEDINWVPAENMHVTLHFLGNTEIEIIEDLKYEFKNAAKKICSFEIEFSQIGIFKKGNQPKILWIGFKHNDELNKLYVNLKNIVTNSRFKIDNRKYNPHLTLARIKKPMKNKDLQIMISGYKPQENQSKQTVNSFILFESILNPNGAVYKIIESFKLSN